MKGNGYLSSCAARDGYHRRLNAEADSRSLPVNKLRSDELVLEHLGRPCDTLSTIDVGVHEGPSQTDSLDTQRKELENISSVADTAVGVNFDLLEDLGVFVVDFQSDFKR